MCNCSKASCGACNTIKQQRGPRGLQGLAGFAGQVSYGNGPPVSNPGQSYGLYQDGALNGNYWQWAPGGPWVDTGIQVAGADGTNGINAFTTTTANFTMPIVNGPALSLPVVNGDWAVAGQKIFVFGLGYLRVQIPSTSLIVVSNEGGTTNAAPGTPSVAGAGVSPAAEPGVAGVAGLTYVDSGPNVPGGLPPGFNSGIFYQTPGTIHLWNGFSFVNTGIPTTGGGGGGIGSLAQVAATPGVSPYPLAGDMGGGNNWFQRRSILQVPQIVTQSGSSYSFTYDYPFYILTVNADIQLSLPGTPPTAPSTPADCEYTFRLTNGGASMFTITYQANRWTKNPGITHPTQINPGETIVIICRLLNNKLNIINVEQNVVAI
jgi:hypothetical protein